LVLSVRVSFTSPRFLPECAKWRMTLLAPFGSIRAMRGLRVCASGFETPSALMRHAIRSPALKKEAPNMGNLTGKPFAKADDTVSFPNGKNEIIKINGFVMSKNTFEPGWRWSNDVKPIAKTGSCEVHHRGYVVSGRLMVRANDGAEMEFGPDMVYEIPPGHDGWVVGDEPVVMVEVGGEEYARPPA
jgi:mannose-6-phosphate isomerase-like protein (cupin superfamily)